MLDFINHPFVGFLLFHPFHKSTATPWNSRSTTMPFFHREKGIIPRSRWRRSALVFAATALLTFIINLSFVIWATTHSSDDPSGVVRPGIGIIASGECQRIKSWNTGAHVVINIISTVLLTGSNYCMQCLIAPTRKEIDTAHAQNDWLDVGIPSIRNFWRIAWKRKIVWSLLALSSFPLHLLYGNLVTLHLCIDIWLTVPQFQFSCFHLNFNESIRRLHDQCE